MTILAADPIKNTFFKVDADLALSCLLATLGRERGRGVVSAFPFSDVGTCFCVEDSEIFPNCGLWKFNGGWIFMISFWNLFEKNPTQVKKLSVVSCSSLSDHGLAEVTCHIVLYNSLLYSHDINNLITTTMSWPRSHILITGWSTLPSSGAPWCSRLPTST